MTDQPKVYLYSEFEGTAYVTLIATKVGAQNDTTTLTDYTSIGTVQAIRKDTGAAVTTTVAANVITFTSVLTNVLVLVLVWGQRQ
jgi:hypothetical protein